MVGLYSGASFLIDHFFINTDGDLRSYWPLFLLIILVVAFLHALLFSAITQAYVGSKKRFAVAFNAGFVALLLLKSVLYNTFKVDWSAVNSGQLQLTSLQKVLHSALTFWVMYGIFLASALMVVVISRYRRRSF
jgi:hypothetical protein